jgi:peptide/nickel transport system ATP-binding protein/oligopeptide transport system ATP-binding protein
MPPLLEIKNLRTHFATEKGTVKAVDGVDLVLHAGDTLGIVGESGCGKTVLALSILRLIPIPPGRIVSGEVLFDGRDLLALREDEMRQVRGRDISMVFQEPMTSLNPVIKIGEQIAEGIRLHQGLNGREAGQRAVEMLRLVGIPAPETRVDDYPHQMSGGMRQRVMIAMALACDPRLMIADEPTTALDVTIQAQILDLISRLKADKGTAVMLVTHDLGVIAEAAQQVAVMYAGRIVEQGLVAAIFERPLHPYTLGLLRSMPKIDGSRSRRNRLTVIPGSIPPLYDLPAGCSFQDRCGDVMAVCRERQPETTAPHPGHEVRCWKHA